MTFESLLVTDQGANEAPIDVGRLGESLIFYDSVHLVVGPRQLEYVLEHIDAAVLTELLETASLHVTYRDFVHATHTRTDGVIEFHTPIFVGAETFRLDALLEQSLAAFKGGRQIASKLLDLIKVEDRGPENYQSPNAFLNNAAWTTTCIANLLEQYIGRDKFTDDVRLALTKHDSGFTVDTNINFKAINASRPAYLPELNAARFMGMVCEACNHLVLASRSNADLHTSSLTSVVSRNLMLPVLAHTERSDGNVERFQTMLFESGHAIAEAINSGQRSFDELIPVLARARNFKRWLSDHTAATELVHAYYRDVSTGTWLTNLPLKTFRWLVTTSLGLIPAYGTVAGAASSLVDSFLIDELAHGWRPNQFVDGPLRRFVLPKPAGSV
jgi:hypothetical protein